MESIIQNLLTNWTFMRWLRLGLAIFIGVQAIQHSDALAGLISGLFLFQVVTNTGCCGSSGCAVPPARNNGDFGKSEYQEAKHDND